MKKYIIRHTPYLNKFQKFEIYHVNKIYKFFQYICEITVQKPIQIDDIDYIIFSTPEHLIIVLNNNHQ